MFCRKIIGAKSACKMLVKFMIGRKATRPHLRRGQVVRLRQPHRRPVRQQLCRPSHRLV